MKKLFTISTLLLLSLTQGNAQTISGSLTHDGMVRTYRLHLPTGYNGQQHYPLVIAIHGGAIGNSTNMESMTLLSDKADKEGFLVVYPQSYSGTTGDGFTSWNAEGCCGAAKRDKIDDVGFISDLIDKISNDYLIDSKQVFATGMSNGGMMCYRLATELSNKIAAVAPVASTMVNTANAPLKPISILHIHSYKDKHVPYTGGYGFGLALTSYQPVFDVLNKTWSNLESCGHTNDTLYKGSDYTHIVWNSCQASNALELYITEDGGHSWPGGPGKGTFGLITDAPSKAFSANDVIWDFFKKHPSPRTAQITNPDPKASINIYPNPTQNTINIEVGDWDQGYKVTFINIYGDIVYHNNVLHYSYINTIDVSTMPRGVYVIRVDAKKQTVFKRVVLN